VELTSDGTPHRVAVERDGEHRTLEGRWVVDATGRRRLLQKKLGLARPSPNRSSAAWFRVPERIHARELTKSDATEWHARDVDDQRWLSTIHLMGTGYWVWLIPLSTGYTSVGIVADTENHPFDGFNRPERALAWLREHEPAVASRLEGVDMADFGVMREYSYLSERTLSPDRWACVGEAGVFVDPLLSPGSDFIALSNSFAARVIGDDVRGRHDPEVIEELNRLYREASEDACRTLAGNGRIFPHGNILGAKLWWDFFNYWCYVSECFAQGLFRLPADRLRAFGALGRCFFELNEQAQNVCDAWARLRPPTAADKPFVPLPLFPSVLADRHLEIVQRRTPDEVEARMNADIATGRELVTELIVHALRDLGPERAAEFGRLTDLPSWSWTPSLERLEADDLGRRERRDKLPRIARDLERALGRAKSDASVTRLVQRALGEGTEPHASQATPPA
jgi:hypothetical protein